MSPLVNLSQRRESNFTYGPPSNLQQLVACLEHPCIFQALTEWINFLSITSIEPRLPLLFEFCCTHRKGVNTIARTSRRQTTAGGGEQSGVQGASVQFSGIGADD